MTSEKLVQFNFILKLATVRNLYSYTRFKTGEPCKSEVLWIYRMYHTGKRRNFGSFFICGV